MIEALVRLRLLKTYPGARNTKRLEPADVAALRQHRDRLVAAARAWRALGWHQ